MSDLELPEYEVEFIPAERRLQERRGAGQQSAYGGPERRSGARREDDASELRSTG